MFASLTPRKGDPADEMYKQATNGDVDFITGDYLAGLQSLVTVEVER